jgi:hypothetical protein
LKKKNEPSGEMAWEVWRSLLALAPPGQRTLPGRRLSSWGVAPELRS